MDNADITAIMPEENIYKVAYPSTVKIVNGQLVYIMLDISKPVNTFLDLRQYFNGGQGDHGNVLPLMFAQNGRPLNTAGYTVKMRGAYPDGTAFELTADQSGSGNAIFNFNFLPGFFQTVGRYTFQIELDNGQTSSHRRSASLMLNRTCYQLLWTSWTGCHRSTTNMKNGRQRLNGKSTSWNKRLPRLWQLPVTVRHC